MLTQQHPGTLGKESQSSPPIEVIDLLKSAGETSQGDCIETMSNGDYSEQAFGSEWTYWSELNLTDAEGNSPPQHEELINRNVKMIEAHIVNVMKWRKMLIKHHIDRVRKRRRNSANTSSDTSIKKSTCIQQTPVVKKGNTNCGCNESNETERSKDTIRSKSTLTTVESSTAEAREVPVKQSNIDSKFNAECGRSKHVGCSLLSQENEHNNCLPQRAKKELILFITLISQRYNDVLYHNFEHASHVTACVHQLVMMLQEGSTESVSRRSSVLTSSSSLSGNCSSDDQLEVVNNADVPTSCESFISTNPVVHLALVFTALIHDVEHQGIGNKQLVSESDPLAMKYKGKSVAENNSFDVSSSLLQQDRFYHLRQSMFGEFEDVLNSLSSYDEMRCANVQDAIKKDVESYKSLYHQISHDVIMATDISCPLRLEKGKLKWIQAFEGGGSGSDNSTNSTINCGAKVDQTDLEKSFYRSSRRSSFPQVSQSRKSRRKSAPHDSDAPTEFIADPFPDLTKITPSERNFCWTEKLNLNGSTEITCPLCISSSTRNDAFACMPYLRLSTVLEQMIQTADVGHTMQSWPVFLKWNEKLYNELWVANKEKRGPDCLDQWFQGQISFFDNYIFPLAERLKQCGVFGELGSLFYENACSNRTRWMNEGNVLCREMHENASKEYGVN